ncbi:hypothetical protein CXF59_08700, partial [Flavobacterium sp. ALD4]|uniref:hypothetical protein n=1 Tax=Flavobacterium sp. ALD4 TaxID=2058314 RepID=UPI000CC55F0B
MKTFLLKFRFLAFVFLLANLVFANAAFSQATVITDKADYLPGETVTISGEGWYPNEIVSFKIKEIPSIDEVFLNFTVQADANGVVVYNQFMTEQRHLGKAFLMRATGGSSGLIAENHFTDATYTVSKNGPWSASDTWGVSSGFPIAGDAVTINEKKTVTLSSNASANTLNIAAVQSGAGTSNLLVETYSLTTGNNLNLTSSGADNKVAKISVSDSGSIITNNLNLTTGSNGTTDLILSGVSRLTVSGAITITGSNNTNTFSLTSIVEYNGADQSVVKFNSKYANVVLSGSGVKTFAADLAIDGNLTINSGVKAKLNGFGSTANSLTLGGVNMPAGTYGSSTSTAKYKNDTYFDSSTVGVLTVATGTCVVPSITTQPTSPTVITYGANATFTVAASSATGYQWQVNTNNGSTWSDIGGATSSTLSLVTPTVAMSTNQYRCVVRNTCGTVNSNPAILTVNQK